MSPRPGGEADKLGNRYEAAWAIRHALYCLTDDAYSLTLEDIDSELGQGSEFTYQGGTSIEVHQLKRQNGNSNNWTVKSLADLRVFDAAAGHVAAGRHFHFVSLVPCRPLQELSNRARQSSDLASFTQDWLTKDLRAVFDELCAERTLGNPRRAWETLRGMWFSIQDENDIVRVNEMLAAMQLSGATGHMISLTIGDILLDNLGKKLTRSDLLELLDQRGISPVQAVTRASIREQVRMVSKSWRESVRRELLEPRIERAEAAQVIEALRDHRTSFVAGTAGGGKSSVLEQSIERLEATGAEVLAFRLDRLDSFASTIELGRQLGLDTSPAVSLALAADGQDAYLVIDQLDAVSLASGRMSESFDVIMDLIGEATSVPGIKVILACREFDIDNDHRIRGLANKADTPTVSVGPLPVETVEASVSDMGLDATRLTSSQRDILRLPMHLVLLKTIADQPGALAFQSKGSLFDAYWERKRRASRARGVQVRFNEVIRRVANEMSKRQTLSIPIEILDDADLIDDANVLVSEHVLARDKDRIAFFHETFFDYAFARQWVSQAESLLDFLLRDEQELFRRAQVRQILQHMYEREADRFRAEAAAVLTSDQVRFHIKETVLALLSNLSTPTSEDAEVITEVAAVVPSIAEHLWLYTRRAPWFYRFYTDGYVDTWLDSGDPKLEARALNLMTAGSSEHPSKVAGLLNTRRAAPQYLDWVRWTVGRAEAHHSREMFDHLLQAVREGGFDSAEDELWLAVYELSNHKPLWAIELLQARIVEHPEGLQLDGHGKVAVLEIRNHSASELIRDAANAEPLAFAEAVIPYLLRVMAVTSYDSSLEAPIPDRHFSSRVDSDSLHDDNLGDAMYNGSIDALDVLVRTSPTEIREMLEELAADPHDSAQFLLYRTLTTGAATFTDWAADLLLEGGARINCGYVPERRWVARELLQAIAPRVGDKVHRQLEDQFRDLRSADESPKSSGRSAFTFLSALEESRLSPTGRRRLAEYRRKFHESVPPKPIGITGGWIGPPIASDSASKMSDEQWLRAMIKYDSDETNWDTFTGGARQLARVLSAQTTADPSRFARLALRLTPDLNSAYAEELLMGFAEARHSEEAAPVIYDALRHIARLGHEGVDRWLGSAIQHYYREVPLDLVELILQRALHSSDPEDDSPILTREDDDGHSAADMHNNAINTARGSLNEALGDLLVFDADGQRTELVRPHLDELASDPVLFVRTSVAHTLSSALRHARPDAVTAFHRLIDAEDRILAAASVSDLMIFIGNVEPTIVEPIILRMLDSSDSEVREAGGKLAAFAALEWERTELMTRAMGGDTWTKKGAAEVCANRIAFTLDAELASSTLVTLMNDDQPEVLKSVAEVAASLRGRPLRPFTHLLGKLVQSPAYEYATPQLLITLERAPDEIDELVLQASQQFISIFGSDASDIRTGAAADAHDISQLVVRALAQTRDKAHRAALLTVLDEMLKLNTYGVQRAIAVAERQ